MKNRKIKLLVIILALASIITAFSVAVFASGDEPRVKLQIKAANLSFDDSVYTLYAVAIEGAEADGMKLLFWNEPKASTDEYKIGTEDHSAEIHGTAKVSGTTCYTFKNTKLRAKNMADDVYARAYIEVDGVGYYSEIVKYSILQYAYNKLGLTGTAGGESLQKMLKSMLEYGAAAQEYFGYRTDRLANGEFYQVRTTGGTLSDGTARGLYLKGSEVTISANEEMDGKAFTAWHNSNGEVVSTDNPAKITVGKENETYTAVYEKYSLGLEYTLSEDGTYYIVSGIGSCKDAELIIPEIHEGLPILKIGSWAFYDCSSLTSIVIPDSVTEIGSYAFYDCSSLTSVVIGDGVTTIDRRAFYYCTSLTSVVIPDSVTAIGNSAFASCSSLTSITVGENNTAYRSINGNLYTKDGKTLIQYAIGKADISFVIPDSVTKIGAYAFRDCSSLTSVVIGDNVTEIGDDAFSECYNLMSIVIGDSVTEIGDNAFASCSCLTSVVIPDRVTEIGFGAFQNCYNLTSIVIPDRVTTIGEAAFGGCSRLSSVVIGDSVTEIGDGAFSRCSSLISTTVGENNTAYKSINGNLYTKDGKSLIQYAIGKADTSFEIPDSVTKIGYEAFEKCSSLTSVVISDRVTEIGAFAFYNCESLTSVVIPDSVTKISDWAFDGCNNLNNVYYKGTAEDWNAITIYLYNDNLTSATRYYYSETTPTENGNFWHYVDGVPTLWPEYVAPIYSEGLKYTLSGDGTYYIVSGIGSCKDTDLIIPPIYDGLPVKEIGDATFEYCYSPTSVVIPDSVTKIGDSAFYLCDSLTSVVIPDSVTEIGEWAFYNCSSLTSITVDENNTAYKSINGNLYTKDGKTLIQYAIGKADTSFEIPDSVTEIGEWAFFDCSSLTSIVIPDSVTEIGWFAFGDCTSLTSVVIGDSVTKIGSEAFYYCTSLKNVYYKGTAEDWSAITINSGNDNLTSATRYYYSETTPTEEGNYWYYNENDEVEIWQ